MHKSLKTTALTPRRTIRSSFKNSLSLLDARSVLVLALVGAAQIGHVCISLLWGAVSE